MYSWDEMEHLRQMGKDRKRTPVRAYPSTNKCQLCNRDLREYGTFYDAKTLDGPWGWLCLECFQFHGCGIGTGLGQEYDSKTDEKLRG